MTTPLTLQQVFDNALQGVRKQNYEPCGEFVTDDDENGSRFACLYRGPDGNKCAFGWSIPDELYNPEMESRPASAVCETDGLAPLFEGIDRDALCDIQKTHDDLYNGEHFQSHGGFWFETRMEEIAKEYGLAYTPLND